MRISLIFALAAVLALPAAAEAIPPPIGGLSPVPGGCLTETPTAGCTTAPGAGDAGGIAVSPNGKAVYVVQGVSATANSMGAVLAYARDPQTGLIGNRISCRAVDPTNLPGCTADPSLDHARQLAIAPDGHGIYVIGTYGTSGSLVSFATDPQTGAIGAPTSCFLEASANLCGAVASHVAYGLQTPTGVVVSPDGKTVYTSALGSHGGLAAFARLGDDGSLTAELRCVSGYASPTGDGAAGKCDLPVDTAVIGATAVAANNKAAYAVNDPGTNNGDVVAYGRDAAAGTLTGRLNCFSENTTTGCSGRFGLISPEGVASAPDAKTLYVGGLDADFAGGQLTTIRLAANGSLSLVASCLDSKGQDTCTKTAGVHDPVGFAFSPGGAQLYVADTANGISGSVSAFGLALAVPQLPALSCHVATATAGCGTLATVHEASGIAISPDARFVYVSSRSVGGGGGAIQAFARELAPSCSGVTASTTAGTPVSVPLSCSDPNGDPLTLSVATAPSNGTLGAVDSAARTVSYTPNAGFVGHDSFTYKATDGRASAAPATAGIDVTEALSPNTAPSPAPTPSPDPTPPPDPTPSPNPTPTADPTPSPAPSTCKVPKLVGLKLTKAKTKLAKAHCKLGKVTRPRRRPHVGLVVTKQSPRRGATTAKPVNLRLGKKRR